VLSDFWPHGEVAQRYGVPRGDGMAEQTRPRRGGQKKTTLALLVRALDLVTNEGPRPKPAEGNLPQPK